MGDRKWKMWQKKKKCDFTAHTLITRQLHACDQIIELVFFFFFYVVINGYSIQYLGTMYNNGTNRTNTNQ